MTISPGDGGPYLRLAREGFVSPAPLHEERDRGSDNKSHDDISMMSNRTLNYKMVFSKRAWNGAMEIILRVLAEVVFIQTARLVLRPFGGSSMPEWAALILGMIFWGLVALMLVAILR